MPTIPRIKSEDADSVYVPLPVNWIVCGLPPPLSLIFTVADRVPVVTGLKVTLIVQEAPGARWAPQALLPVTTAKSPALAPLMDILLKFRVRVVE